jgi:hypothetical protein
MIAAAFECCCVRHSAIKYQQCDLESMSATSVWHLPLSLLEFQTCWRPHVIFENKSDAHMMISALSLPANSVCASSPHDMHVCAPHPIFGPSVPHPPPAPLGVYPPGCAV